MVDLLGSFVSALLQVLFDRMAHRGLIDFFRGNHLDEALLDNLKMLLLSVTAVLNDAEEKQFFDPLVKEWVDKLKNVAYDADDVLDEISTKAIQDKMDPRFNKSLDKVRDYASSLNPFCERVQSKIGRIVERLKCIIEHKNLLGLKEGGVDKTSSSLLELGTSSLVDENHVYGRHDDREKVIDFLLAGDINGERVPVVAIVGMGGVGKTTLAQIMYNDERVRNHFQSRSWASVSETSNVYEITKKVFESFTLMNSNILDLNVLQIKLRDRLSRQRFLLVLDGFWNENFLDWDILQRPFPLGKYGSRIIVTTRSQSVATLIRADLTHSLSFLSDEDTWKLFASHAFKSGNPNDHPILAQIGRKIVKKCNGLPLAAKALGSLLRSKDAGEWEGICYSRLWELPIDRCSILPALRLSYSRLPSHLKRCFTYCSIFPKGFEIKKSNLIYLWMAEGILPQQKSEKRMEDVGEECFQELLSRSFFYQSTYHASHYMMHDLIHDVAQFIAGDLYYNLDDNNPRKITDIVRHLSYLQGIYDDPEKFEIFSEFRKLRTFLPFKFSYFAYSSSITSMVYFLLPKLKLLRVLTLTHYPITKLPYSIGKLTHLRYLDLSYTRIECLPDSICTLYNLETLLLSGCHSLTMLPENMSNLVNMRQLNIYGSTVTAMPAKFGKLKSLQVLTNFIVGCERGSKINELGELSELHGALLIGGLQNVVDPVEASNVKLKSKKYLYELEFQWTSTTHDEESETKVLNMLEPHKNVKMLKIQNFGGNIFPSWLGSSSFSSMVILHLANCQNSKSLPSLGQLPSLSELYISTMKSLQKVGLEFYGNVIEPFRSLKVLKFEDMPNLEEWSTNNFEENMGFPSLIELYIESCPKLTTKLPEQLPSLDKLVITGCQALTCPMPWVPKLRELVLTGCDALVSLSEKMILGNKCLQIMAITNCSSLVSIPIDGLPSTLQSLEIYECRNLQLSHPQTHSLNHQSNFYSSLEKLHLKCCDSLVSFPFFLFHKLEDLCVQDCSNLVLISSTPNILPHLRKLKLKQCSKLTHFSEEGLYAPKLESLCISKCVNFSSNTTWGLQTLTSLTFLHISGLPSLTSLEHTGVQYLTSLKTLKIKACANLSSLPLEKLVISLYHLTIKACPLLIVLCEKDIGQYWNLVSLIPFRIIED